MHSHHYNHDCWRCISPMMITVMTMLMGDGCDDDPYLFHIRFKSPVRPDWGCRGCVVIIIIMTVGDAEDAR